MARRSAPLLLLALFACSCGGFSPASELVKPPEFSPVGQTQCQVKKSQEKPLIIEWPSADRAELEATAKSGTVVVSYNGCEMRVLSRCRAPGKYAYVPVTPKADTVTIKNDDELYANIPIYAAKFEAKLAQTGQLNVAMTMVGRYATDQGEVKLEQLIGACQGATHIVSGLTVGAFEFFAGAGAEVGGGVEVMGAGAGAKSTAKKETLTRDGSAEACVTAVGAQDAPPPGCGALLRVEVAPVAGVIRKPDGTAAPGVLLLEEHFDDDRRGWLQFDNANAKFAIEAGRYLLESKRGGFWLVATGLDVDASRDYSLHVKVQKLGGTDSYFFGLAFGQRTAQDFLQFVITGDGRYGLARLREGEAAVDLLLGDSPAVRRGNATNVLRVSKVGNSFRAFVNEQPVGTCSAQPWPGGGVGFLAYSGNETIKLAFDDLIVSSP